MKRFNRRPLEALEKARLAVRRGNLIEAERAYLRYLKISPTDVESLAFTAFAAARRGNFQSSEEILKQSILLDPTNISLRIQLGVVLGQAGDAERAREVFETALQINPDSYLVRLHLGETLEVLGEKGSALRAYLKAIIIGQSSGVWLSDNSTPIAYRDKVKNAIAFVERERKSLFDNRIENLKAKFGSNALVRIERAIGNYLNGTPIAAPDGRQRPSFLYIPDLSNTPFFDRSLFPFFEVLEDNWRGIRDEFMSLLDSPNAFLPVHGHLDENKQNELVGRGESGGSWDAVFFYRNGERNQENGFRCQYTVNALEKLPLVRIRDHAPEILFSILQPGAHIKPHRGVSNLRTEPPRDSRRLLILREWSHDKQKQTIFTGSERACRTAGVRASV